MQERLDSFSLIAGGDEQGNFPFIIVFSLFFQAKQSNQNQDQQQQIKRSKQSKKWNHFSLSNRRRVI
jgi:hypothetical protein